eukprot:TRINITY_DN4301_c0_g1_i2.p1 TRINITY_DN4301_c0_g1~~TRINITY_DN4301_c0_g1_i2.p1  ORF type:complete len:331 (-),score=55.83 TRINITY_DN4301_c0_g1_i2:56-1048(-)
MNPTTKTVKDSLEGPVIDVQERIKQIKATKIGDYVHFVHNIEQKNTLPEVHKLYYLLYGATGDGKSAFLNTLATILQGSTHYAKLAEVAPPTYDYHDKRSTTLEMTLHELLRTENGDTHVFCDTRGVTTDNPTELFHLLQGEQSSGMVVRIGENPMPIIRRPLYHGERIYVDVVVVVVSAHRLLKSDDSPKELYQELKTLGFVNTRIIILTHWDLVPEEKQDITFWSRKLGVDPVDIFPVINYVYQYSPEKQWCRDENTEKLAVKALMEIMKRGEESLLREKVLETSKFVKKLKKIARISWSEPLFLVIVLFVLAIVFFVKDIRTTSEIL